jgi:hypothetical protein
MVLKDLSGDIVVSVSKEPEFAGVQKEAHTMPFMICHKPSRCEPTFPVYILEQLALKCVITKNIDINTMTIATRHTEN